MPIENKDDVVQFDVLIVDDVPENLNLLSDILKKNNYNVRLATDATIALRSIKARKPFIIILDVQLPGIDGYEFCRMLKNDNSTKGIPVIFITAHTSLENIVKSFEVGGVDFISKPIVIEEVLSRVNTHVTKRKLQLEAEQLNITLKKEIDEHRLDKEKLIQSNELINTHLEQEKKNKNALLSILQDQKEVLSELKKSEKEFRNLAESMPQMVWITRPDGWNIYFNQQWVDYTGLTLEESYGDGWNKPFHPDDKQKAWDAWQNATKNNAIYSIESRLRRVDGVYNWFLVRGVPILDADGTILKWFGTCTDINELKIAEDELRESEKRFRITAKNLTDVIFDWDIKENIHWYGDIDGITGYKPGGFPRTLEGWAATIHPEDKDRVTAALDDHIKHSAKYAVEYRVRRRDGEWRWWSARGIALRNDLGEPYKMMGSITDITEQKEIQNRVKFKSELLSHIGQSVIATDLQGNVIYWNKGAEEIYGWSSDEVMGQNIVVLTPAEQTKEQSIQIMKALSKGNSWSGEFLVKRKDGSSFPAEVTDAPIIDSDRKLVGIIGISSDITERKRIEDKLRNSEERFKILFDYAPDAYYLSDLKGNFVDGNIAAEKLLGYDKNELIGKSFLKLNLLSPIQLFKAAKLLAKNLLGQATGPDEFVLDRKDGSKVTIEISTHPVKIKDQTLVLGIARDITERKRTEEEITVLAHSLRSIKECVSITDMEDKIIFINESFLKTYGYDENELVGKNMKIVRSSKNPHELVNKILPSTILGGWQGELWNKRKNGSEFLINLSTTVINDDNGKPLGLIGVAADITEKKKMETDLSSAAEIARLGYWEYDVGSEQFTFNDQYYRLIHGTSTEKQGGNIMSAEEFVRRFVYPDDASMIAKNLQEAISSPDPEYFGNAETRVFREDGKIANVSVRFKVLKDSSGHTYKIYGINQDVTESKRAEIELIEAKNRAEQSDKLKSEFLAQMSHEVRSPMNAIISFANLLKEDLSKDLTPDHLEYFAGIDSAGHRLIRTVELILNASELQVGTYIPDFTDIGLMGEILEKINNEYILLIEEKGLKYNFISNISEAVIHGDKYSIYQVFVNLMDNAVNYTEKGSISVIVEKDKNTSEIKVTIEDTGIGMSEEYMGQMYKQFTQENRGYTRRYEGNGLGLTLVKKYCELNGITIDVKSKKGIGTQFVLIFTNKIIESLKD